MDHIDSLVAAKLASLQPSARHDWDSGPYTEDELQATERRLGRALDLDHRAILKEIGGRFTFEYGSVEVGSSDLDVAEFYGVSEDDLNIADKWYGYRGQIPEAWYPFAEDFDGHMYCLTEGGAVHHIELVEELWTRDERPATAGKRVADSFVQFVMSLRLPDWVVAHLRDSPGETNGPS